MKQSYWKTNTIEYPTLQQNISCDICIIGGGLNGIALAYLLQDHQDVVIVEQDRFHNASTSLNTGKLTAQHDDCYHKIKQKHGIEVAKMYYQHNKEAIALVKKWHTSMDFELQNCDSTLFTKNNQSTLQKEYQTYQELHIPCTYTTSNELDLLTMKEQYLFHPVQLANALLKQLHIRCYQNTKIINYEKQTHLLLHTEQGYTIQTKKAIFCTHSITMYPSLLLFSRYKANSSYILMKPFCWKKPLSMISIDQPSLSLRSIQENHQKYLLVCNQDHRVGILPTDAYALLDKQTTFLNTPIHNQWQNHDYLTFDHLPFIGSLEEDIYITFGYQMWGNSWSIASGILLKNLLLFHDKKSLNPYRPQRIRDFLTLDYIKENILTGCYWIWFYLERIMKKPNGTIKWKHKTYGFYQDTNHIYFLDIHCPHMYCILQYNDNNQTWDCPCHASSFTLEGKRLCGPTTHSLKTIFSLTKKSQT